MIRTSILLSVLCFSTLFQQPCPAKDWLDVDNWVYQLTNYKDAKLTEIAESEFDLAVVDLARDGGSDFFSRQEIKMVKDSGKIALAYFEIGAIEDFRPEWNLVPEDLKSGKVDGWPNEQYVRFWDQRWWPIIKGRVDQAIGAGFDGAYLDLITAYEEIPGTKLKSEERAQPHGRPDCSYFRLCKIATAELQDRSPELSGAIYLVFLGAQAEPALHRCD